MTPSNTFDLIIVGGGIGGIISLYYARKAGLKAVLLEKNACVGGLWSVLPDWQDIQNRKEDWTLGDLPLEGEDRASIEANIRSWVTEFDLSADIVLDQPVVSATHSGTEWVVRTPSGVFVATALISATGVHNRPKVPDVVRRDSRITEFHSSTLHDPQVLAGKMVIVVGGGASGFDLVDLCLERESKTVDWVYRSLRWMAPTDKPKRFASNVRALAKAHMLGASNSQISREINADLRARYAKFNIEELLPDTPFDLDRDQLVPGRWRLIGNLPRVGRHRSEISAIDGNTVTLRSGEEIAAEIILWGTGFEMDLSYLAPLSLAEVRDSRDLAARCGSLVVAHEAPNLYFISVDLESTNATPWLYAHFARTIVAQICGNAALSAMPVPICLNYFDVPTFLAPFDTQNFPLGQWRDHYLSLVTTYPNEKPLPVPEALRRA